MSFDVFGDFSKSFFAQLFRKPLSSYFFLSPNLRQYDKALNCKKPTHAPVPLNLRIMPRVPYSICKEKNAAYFAAHSSGILSAVQYSAAGSVSCVKS